MDETTFGAKPVVRRLIGPLVRLLMLVAAMAAATLLLAIFLALGGIDAGRALQSLWNGSLGSPYALFSATLVRATPLILAGLAVTLAFTAGILNVGAEGQLLAGAAAAAAVGVTIGPSLGHAALPLELFAGAAAGALWASIASELRRRYGVLEVISTIMLNFVAAYGVSYLVRGPLQEPLRIYPQTETLGAAARLPVLWSGTRLHAGFLIAVAAAVVLWYVLTRSAAGFRLRASGANARAAASAGRIDVAAVTARAFLASGAIAGLAGAVEVAGVTFALYENLSPGYGYTAIAVALLAGLDPLAVIASGTLFGALEAGASAMQRDAGVPSVIVSVVEAVIVLMVLALGRLRRAGGFGVSWTRGGTPTAESGT